MWYCEDGNIGSTENAVLCYAIIKEPVIIFATRRYFYLYVVQPEMVQLLLSWKGG